MRAFREFVDKDYSFWSIVKFISERLGYSTRRQNQVKSYSYEEIEQLCRVENVEISSELIDAATLYCKMRADLLNNFAEGMLMTAEQAAEEFSKWQHIHRIEHYYCKLPMNKQKGAKKQVAFFTSIINIITEKTIREITGRTDILGFDDNPGGLVYILDEYNNIIGTSSRRFDGALPGLKNPVLVWEIKEYYYATTFGSRVADGVYETQLDGFELKNPYERTGRKVYHVLFIDAYRTWWTQGKSYLCRLVDAINSGVVDEVVVGAEVFTRWPELLQEIIC